MKMSKILVLASAAALAISLSAHADVVVIDSAAFAKVEKISASYDLVKPDFYVVSNDGIDVAVVPGYRIPDGDGNYELPAGVSAKSVTAENRYQVPPRIGWRS
jgi:opacity protein-like surface antigen